MEKHTIQRRWLNVLLPDENLLLPLSSAQRIRLRGKAWLEARQGCAGWPKRRWGCDCHLHGLAATGPPMKNPPSTRANFGQCINLAFHIVVLQQADCWADTVGFADLVMPPAWVQERMQDMILSPHPTVPISAICFLKHRVILALAPAVSACSACKL